MAPLDLPKRPYTATPFTSRFHIPENFPTLPHRPCWSAKNGKKTPEAKTAWNAIECENANDSGGNSMLPIFQKYVIPGCFS
jgi:hypothetical protein